MIGPYMLSLIILACGGAFLFHNHSFLLHLATALRRLQPLNRWRLRDAITLYELLYFFGVILRLIRLYFWFWLWRFAFRGSVFICYVSDLNRRLLFPADTFLVQLNEAAGVAAVLAGRDLIHITQAIAHLILPILYLHHSFIRSLTRLIRIFNVLLQIVLLFLFHFLF